MPLYEHSIFETLSKIDDDDFIRLVYVSSLTLKSRIDTKIFATVEQEASRYNHQKGVTGTLCYGNGHFLQCVEGNKKVLMPLLSKIFDDKRHKHIKVLLVQPKTVPKFDNWAFRLLFLERWLWSPTTKKQANSLSEFLPFNPYSWSPEYTEGFLNAVQKIETPPYINKSGITLNAMGNMIQHVVGPHQTFLLVQGILGLLVILALVFLLPIIF